MSAPSWWVVSTGRRRRVRLFRCEEVSGEKVKNTHKDSRYSQIDSSLSYRLLDPHHIPYEPFTYIDIAYFSPQDNIHDQHPPVIEDTIRTIECHMLIGQPVSMLNEPKFAARVRCQVVIGAPDKPSVLNGHHY